MRTCQAKPSARATCRLTHAGSTVSVCANQPSGEARSNGHLKAVMPSPFKQDTSFSKASPDTQAEKAHIWHTHQHTIKLAGLRSVRRLSPHKNAKSQKRMEQWKQLWNDLSSCLNSGVLVNREAGRQWVMSEDSPGESSGGWRRVKSVSVCTDRDMFIYSSMVNLSRFTSSSLYVTHCFQTDERMV